MSETEVRLGLVSLFLDPNESSSFFDPTSIHADLPGLQGSFVADEVTATIPPQAVHQSAPQHHPEAATVRWMQPPFTPGYNPHPHLFADVSNTPGNSYALSVSATTNQPHSLHALSPTTQYDDIEDKLHVDEQLFLGDPLHSESGSIPYHAATDCIRYYMDKGRDRRVARMIVVGCRSIAMHDYSVQNSFMNVKHGKKLRFPDKEMKRAEIILRLHGPSPAVETNGTYPPAKKPKRSLPCTDTMRAMHDWLLAHPRTLSDQEIMFFTKELQKFEQQEAMFNQKTLSASVSHSACLAPPPAPSQAGLMETNPTVLEEARNICHQRAALLAPNQVAFEKYKELIKIIGKELESNPNRPLTALSHPALHERARLYVESWFNKWLAEHDQLTMLMRTNSLDETSSVREIILNIHNTRDGIEKELNRLRQHGT